MVNPAKSVCVCSQMEASDKVEVVLRVAAEGLQSSLLLILSLSITHLEC